MTTSVEPTGEPASKIEPVKPPKVTEKNSVRETAQAVRDGDLTVAEAVLKAYQDGFREGFAHGIKHELRGSEKTQKAFW